MGAFLGALGLWRVAFERLMPITPDVVMGQFSVCMPWVMKEILLNDHMLGDPCSLAPPFLFSNPSTFLAAFSITNVTSLTSFDVSIPSFFYAATVPPPTLISDTGLPPSSTPPPSPTLHRLDHQKLIRNTVPLVPGEHLLLAILYPLLFPSNSSASVAAWARRPT